MIKKVFYIFLTLFTLYMAGMYWSETLLIVFFVEVILGGILFLLPWYLLHTIKINMPTHNYSVHKGEVTNIKIEVINTGFLPINTFEVTVRCKNSMAPDSQKLIVRGAVAKKDTNYLTTTICSEYCGIVIVGVTEVKVYDYMSLFSRKKKSNVVSHITVLPTEQTLNIKVGNSFFNTNPNNQNNPNVLVKDGNMADFTVEEYREGDLARHIHWKLKARTDQLWTKKYYDEEANFIIVYLEVYPKETVSLEQWDAFLEIVSAMSVGLLQQGIIHKFSWYDADISNIKEQTIDTYDEYLLVMVQLIKTIDIVSKNTYKYRYTQSEVTKDNVSLTINTNLQVTCNEVSIATFTVENYSKEIAEQWIKIG